LPAGRDVRRDLLAEWNSSVDMPATSNASEAFDIKYDLAIFDDSLPDGDQFVWVKRSRQCQNGSQSIILTA
jgi:DNA-binding response OmpR family regulator